MMKPTHLIVSTALLALPATAPARPAERLLTLDPGATEIRFTLGATLHTVEGSVRVERGEIRFDPAGGPATGEIVVDAASADTGNEGRDEDMHEKVLESGTFGQFVLHPTASIGTLEPSGTSRIELRGQLEIHGDTHEVTLPTELTFDGDRLTGTATFEVPYVDWGMKNPSKFLLRVEKLVQVEIHLAGRVSEIDAAPEPP